jgi:hypothetical protein
VFDVDQISDRVNPYRPAILMTQLKFVVEGLSGTQGRSGKLAECGVIGIRAENNASRLVY